MTGKLKTLLKASLSIALVAGLSGCGEGLGDLRQFVQQIRAKPPGRGESRSTAATARAGPWPAT